MSKIKKLTNVHIFLNLKTSNKKKYFFTGTNQVPNDNPPLEARFQDTVKLDIPQRHEDNQVLPFLQPNAMFLSGCRRAADALRQRL